VEERGRGTHEIAGGGVMAVYKVLLVDEEGTVISDYTVSTVLDFDPEDITAEGEYSYYLVEGWGDLSELGEDLSHDITVTEKNKEGK